MRKTTSFAVIALIVIPAALLLAPVSMAHAAGIGFFVKGEVAAGGPTGTPAPGSGAYGARTAAVNLGSFGGGLLIESASAKDRMLGYRLKLTYEVPPVPGIDTHGFKKPLNRIGMFNTMTIGVVRTESLRFWVGPQVGLSYAFHRDSHSYYTLLPYGGSFIPYEEGGRQITSAMTVDLLMVMGLNAHISDVSSCFFEVGLGYIGIYDLLSTKQGHGFDFQFCAGFLFRVKDSFAAPAPKEQGGAAAPGEQL